MELICRCKWHFHFLILALHTHTAHSHVYTHTPTFPHTQYTATHAVYTLHTHSVCSHTQSHGVHGNTATHTHRATHTAICVLTATHALHSAFPNPLHVSTLHTRTIPHHSTIASSYVVPLHTHVPMHLPAPSLAHCCTHPHIFAHTSAHHGMKPGHRSNGAGC